MAKNVEKLATMLGANVAGTVPQYSAGAFGAAQLAEILQERLVPSRGKRIGRPTDPNWTRRPKVPMTTETNQRLKELALLLSEGKRHVSPMQVAAHILERALSSYFPPRGAPMKKRNAS